MGEHRWSGSKGRVWWGATGIVLISACALAALFTAGGAGSATGPTLPIRLDCQKKVGAFNCHARVVTDTQGTPAVSATAPAGYGPAEFQTAYGLTAAASAPATQTIAIVDAYDSPTVKADLDGYNTTFGMPPFPSCAGASNVGCFRKVNQTGGTTYPPVDEGWALEIALDVQVAHAICPKCGILLVETSSASFSDLLVAEDYASSHASVVSNSWGADEFFGETSVDSHFNRRNVAFTAPSGDDGYGTLYPAASRFVTAVGGTTLTLNPDRTRQNEIAWSGSGSGCSPFEAKPSWQTDASCSRRTVADVSADADPATGAAVYDTTPYLGETGWFQVGGTSLGAPLIASVYALAGNGGSISNGTYPSSFPYANPSSLFDVTSGSNGFCGGSYVCTAKPGYDGPTGLGTPIGTAAFDSPGGQPPPPPPPPPP